ncbi:MAG: ROK family protein [Dehalococcoidia bacterium]|nr:ROK family protein [Dehalococcoidia bacterium]
MTKGTGPADFVVAVDFGATRIRAALMDRQGTLLSRFETPTLRQQGKHPVLQRLESAIEAVAREVGQKAIGSIGMTVPGLVNPWTGVMYESPVRPEWLNVPLKSLLEDRFQVPVHIDNDANLCALAEHRLGAARGVSDLVYLTISIGIGAGIIVDNALLRGSSGLAGEIGHMVIDPRGPRCGCGNTGCLEAMASGPAIARQARESIERGMVTAIMELVGHAVNSWRCVALG